MNVRWKCKTPRLVFFSTFQTLCRYDVMRLCWAGESNKRLSFSKIVQRFEEYLTELRIYVKSSAGFVDPYSHWNLSAAKNVTVKE